MIRYFFVCTAGRSQWDLPAGPPAFTDPFVPSASFTGRVDGYVFKMGAKGLGYYKDVGRSGVVHRLQMCFLCTVSSASLQTPMQATACLAGHLRS